MTVFIIRRLLQSTVIVFIMTVIVFFGVNVIGDPIYLLINPDCDDLCLKQAREALGLDLPLHEQYIKFLRNLVKGDLGRSFIIGVPAIQLIVERMPATLELATCAMLLTVFMGIPLGMWAGLKPYSLSGRIIMGGSIFGFSLPGFWVGLMLIMVFSVQLGWLPSTGRGATVSVGGIYFSFLTVDGLSHLILPATNLALFHNLAYHPADPRRHARDPARRLRQVRPRQGVEGSPRALRPRAQEHPDSGRHRARARTRWHHRLRGGDGVHLFLAGHGQAADRFDRVPRSAGRGQLSDAHRLHVCRHQPDRRHPLFGARSPGPDHGVSMMAGAAGHLTMEIDPTTGAHGRVETPFRRFLSDFTESKIAVTAFFVFTAVLLAALFAPLISPTNPYDLKQLSILDNRLPPGSESMKGVTFWLGSDGLGRDMLSAIFYGLRLSLIVGAMSSLFALIIGMSVGLVAAYFGGRIDNVIMRIVDLQLSFPSILIALILLALLGRGADKTIIALVVVQWANYARNVRGTALVERRREYIDAAECLALRHARIVFRHLLPNCMPPMIVIGTVQVAHAIFPRGDAFISWPRSPADGAVAGPLDRERFRLPV